MNIIFIIQLFILQLWSILSINEVKVNKCKIPNRKIEVERLEINKKCLVGIDSSSCSALSKIPLHETLRDDKKVDDNFFSLSESKSVTMLIPGNAKIKSNVKSNEVFVDSFIPQGKQGDLSIYIQEAVNAAYGKTLVFTSGRNYSFQNVFLPAKIRINLNNSIVNPYLATAGGTDFLFRVDPLKINPLSMIYEKGKVFVPTPSFPTIIDSIEIFGGNFDGFMSKTGFLVFGMGVANSYAKSLRVYNNKFKNFSGDPLHITGKLTITPTSPYIENLYIENNEFKYGGAFTATIVNSNYLTGASSINIKTFDGSKLSDKIIIGRYFQIGTAETSKIDATGTSTTAAIYRCIGFTAGSSPNEGNIIIESGSFDHTNGFVKDEANLGLKAPVVTGAWLIPINFFNYSLLASYPKYGGSAGSTTLTRTFFSHQENAFASNLYPGMIFQFASGGPGGSYTIKAINKDGSLIISPALSSNVEGIRLLFYGDYNAAIFINGEIRNGIINKNYFYGAYEGISIAGINGPFLTWDILRNKYTISDNEFYYCYMSVEATGGNEQITPFISDLKNFTLSSGQTNIPIPTPSNYRITRLDLDKNGIDETLLVPFDTVDENVRNNNSLGVGDIILFMGIQGRYRITELATNGITFARYNHSSKSNVAGGIIDGGTNLAYLRVYSNNFGEYGSINLLIFKNNKFYYNTNAFGGFHLSLQAHETIIDNNEFYNSEKESLEVIGDILRLTNNRFKNYVFEAGGKSMPSLAATSTGIPLRGYGGFANITCADIKIEGNNFEGNQPSDSKFSSQAGRLCLGFMDRSVIGCNKFIIKNNIFKGIAGTLLFSNNNKKINGTYYSILKYDYFEFVDNNLTTWTNHNGTSVLSYTIFADKFIVTDNSFTGNYSDPSTISLINVPPSPELFSTNTYSGVVFKNNRYNKSAFLSKIKFQDKIQWSDAKTQK